MRETFHLVPAAVWEAADPAAVCGRVARDRRVHPLHGRRRTAGRHVRPLLRDDPRPFLALTLDLDALGVPWRYDVPGSPYPHIYGPIDRSAVRGVSRVERAPDGRFSGLAPV